MSVTPRPRRAFVSSSGDSNYILPHSMGWIHDLGNLWEFLPHLLLGHEICLFQDMSRLIIDRDRHSVRVDRFPNFQDRKSTRLNSSHVRISYAVFCLKKKKI